MLLTVLALSATTWMPQDTVRASDVAAGGRNTCGISVLGKTYCWGSNEQGQVGNRSRT